jgi:hypothetical protein
MPRIRNVATGFSEEELRLLGGVIERHAPDLRFLLTDWSHELTLEESDKLVAAIANDFTLTEEGELDGRSVALDDLLGRVNLGPYVR